MREMCYKLRVPPVDYRSSSRSRAISPVVVLGGLGLLSGFVGGGWFHEEGYQRAPTQYDERIALAQLAASSPALGSLLDGQPGVTGTSTLPAAAYPTMAPHVIEESVNTWAARNGA